mmetsp:Transcript_59150/g.139323  ORF Transcript_59150/g.139323 Transcript_59150/m.139323 type:complete len:208 (+) Transcript_59150:6665-7288(+)
MPEQGRLVLRASDGDTELGFLVSRGGHATCGRHGTVQCLLDLGLVQRLGVDALHVGRGGVHGQQLQRADAITADFGEQAEGCRVGQPKARGDAAADGLMVGQQVAEVVANGRRGEWHGVQRQRQGQRQRARLGGNKPGGVVGQLHRPAGGNAPFAHAKAVHPQGQRLGVRRAAGHVTRTPGAYRRLPAPGRCWPVRQRQRAPDRVPA